MCVISPNLGVSKELPCVRDKASKIVKNKREENEEHNHWQRPYRD